MATVCPHPPANAISFSTLGDKTRAKPIYFETDPPEQHLQTLTETITNHLQAGRNSDTQVLKQPGQ